MSVEVGGRSVPLAADEGVFEGRADAGPGDDYRYRLDGGDPLPDPCSRAQPEGVGGPSRVVDPAAVAWDEGGWAGLDRRGLVLYELHVGTFTPEGTFAAAAERLPALARARGDGDRADAGGDLPGTAQLGLRRPLRVGAPPRLRRPGGPGGGSWPPPTGRGSA